MRVAITAPPPGATRLADAVRRRHHEPLLLPCISIEAEPDDVLARARRNARSADVVLLTSARAVDVVWDGAGMDGLSVVAVGEATARAARAAGARVVRCGDGGLFDLVRSTGALPPGTVIAFPHADGAEPDVAAPLGTIVPTAVYRTTPVPPPLDAVAAALFASPSAVDGWHLARDLDGVFTGVIGPTTAAAVIARGHRPVVADAPSLRALAATVPRGS